MPRKRTGQPLTQQQSRRIHAIREGRLERWEERNRQELAQLEQALAGETAPEESGQVIAHYGYNVEVATPQGERVRCAVRETVTENPVCGDRVLWQRAGAGRGVITGIRERRSLLRRPAAFERLQSLAANVEGMMITTTADQLHPHLVDRYLVAAEANGLEPVVLVNKIDQPHDETALEELLAPWQEMGYGVLRLSAKSGAGMEGLDRVLMGRISIFVGQSGVGKSSLVARYIPDEAVKVGEVNQETGKGRHTTTVARLYPLPEGGGLIDSPGIRAFGLHGVEAGEVAHHFREIAPHLGRCRFSDCTHRQEPGCAVLAALEAGKITPRRLESLRRIIEDVTTRQQSRDGH